MQGDLESLKKDFKKFLGNKGRKITKRRLEIIDMIAKYGERFEIEDLVQWINSQNKNVASRSTIYKTVQLLREFGAIREVMKLNDRTIYELALEKQHHESKCMEGELENLKRDFERFLKNKGGKITKGRFEIIDMIANYRAHFEIEDLVRWISSQNKNVASRSTIYRTVRLLQEFGAIREVIKLNNRTIYEFVVGKQHHEHLICVECGKIIEFNKEEIEQLQEKVCEEYDFTPINHRLEIFGICSDCREKRRENRVG
ncbi:MAG: hypothetical protein GU344_00235 [Thermocrinis sp.]|jgi:Fur family ferric uptake transcriptional regulator|nr:hypothetical protein [Thermocrinis sp.]